ncbi:unnamed protein product, partial [Prunus brigantina]
IAIENSSFVQPAIPRFDGHYDHWSMLMENFLISKEYWGLIENGIPPTAEGRMQGNKEEEYALHITNSEKSGGRDEDKVEGRGRARGGFKGRGRGRAELDKEEEMLLMAYVGINQSKRENVWFLDSGCSNHMCGNKECFFDLDKKFRQSVKLGDNSRMMAMGKGNVKLHVNGLTQGLRTLLYKKMVKGLPILKASSKV